MGLFNGRRGDFHHPLRLREAHNDINHQVEQEGGNQGKD